MHCYRGLQTRREEREKKAKHTEKRGKYASRNKKRAVISNEFRQLHESENEMPGPTNDRGGWRKNIIIFEYNIENRKIVFFTLWVPLLNVSEKFRVQR